TVDGCAGFRDYTVVIACPAITLGAIGNGTAGGAYTASVAASPAGTYTYSLLAGNLPTGVTLNSATGALSGLPTVTGTYSFTVKADAGNGCSGTQAYSITVSCPSLSFTPASLSNGTVGTAYSQTITASPA